MNHGLRTENTARKEVLKLLSDGGTASASTVDATVRLLDGEEYLDLDRLDQGVLRATKASLTRRSVLPRRTLHKDTWSKILALLGNASKV
jgi:hypothetical protein